MPANRTFEILDDMIHDLICTDAPLRNRLDTAIRAVGGLAAKDFPPDSRADFEALLLLIERYQSRSVQPPDLAEAMYELFKVYLAVRLVGWKDYQRAVG